MYFDYKKFCFVISVDAARKSGLQPESLFSLSLCLDIVKQVSASESLDRDRAATRLPQMGGREEEGGGHLTVNS